MEFNSREAALLLLATIGPLKVTIVCASLTAEAPPEFLKRVALRSVITAFAVCIVFAVLGEAILQFFKVSVPAFQIGGGIIVLLFSIDMVMGSKQADQNVNSSPAKKNGQPQIDIAVYPLAIPLIASVSGLVAIVSILSENADFRAVLFLVAVIVAIMAIDYVCLRSCRLITRALGQSVLEVIGKLMGVILTGLAIELILTGAIGLGLLAKPAVRASSTALSRATDTPVACELMNLGSDWTLDWMNDAELSDKEG
jgi:multiple antibiotic resistance protein